MKRGTDTRKAFDRALQSLPITQHKDLWVLYIEWVKEFGVPETAVKVFRRYIMFDPFQREQFVNYLEEIEEFSEAASQLTLCIEDANFTSKYGTSRHQLWIKLCDMFAYHPECVPNEFKVESIIRSGIARFSDEVGRLWCRLADYYVRQGLFEKARDIFEEALSSVTTVKDFSVIFDAYIKIEESVLSAKLRLMNEDASDGNEVEESGDVDMRLARLEYLMDKRPILLNSVVLRQNPNNVFEWHKRIKLFKDDTKRLLQAYTEAISTINPSLANGKFSSIWLSFSKHYEAEGDIESARTIFLKATKVDFKSVDELANVWCGWAEMEIRLKNYNKALEVLQNAVSEPSALVKRRRGLVDNTSSDDITSSLHKIHRNVKVWSFYLDLEESLGTFETCCAAYERAFDLKVVTVQMALNYATYLDEKNYFEESFKVYEKALALFTFPQLKVIWLTYLNKFINRYGGSKLERLRDLFEQCVSVVPSEDAAEFYVQYAKAEETYGLSRHAMNILDRATRIVPASQQLQMYRLYAKKVEQYFGVTKSRPIYERAVAELSDEDSKTLCLEFADIERKLGEVIH
jgi:pre-mRNA-splicing factor SYF1